MDKSFIYFNGVELIRYTGTPTRRDGKEEIDIVNGEHTYFRELLREIINRNKVDKEENL